MESDAAVTWKRGRVCARTNLLIDQNSNGDGEPIRENIPNGEEPAEQKHSRDRQAKGIERRRVMQFEEFDAYRDSSRSQSSAR